MEQGGIIRPLWGVALAVSGGIVASVGPLVLPNHKLLILGIGVAIGLIGLIALVADLLSSRKQKENPESRASQSVTAMARGRGKIRLGKVYSAADKLAHVEEEGEISAEEGFHAPAARPARRSGLWWWPFARNHSRQLPSRKLPPRGDIERR